MSFQSSLCILDTSPLLNMWFANIFSCFVVVFYLLDWVLYRAKLNFFSFIDHAFDVKSNNSLKSKNSLLNSRYVWKISPVVFPDNSGVPECRVLQSYAVHTTNGSRRIHRHSGMLLSHEKGQGNAICRDTDRPADFHTEWSQSGREGEMPYDIAYTRNLKKKWDRGRC